MRASSQNTTPMTTPNTYSACSRKVFGRLRRVRVMRSRHDGCWPVRVGAQPPSAVTLTRVDKGHLLMVRSWYGRHAAVYVPHT